MAVRIIADSLAMTARSSAAVLQARTLRIRSLSFIAMMAVIISSTEEVPRSECLL
jgi:metal-dependent HD superfamily phosphatase/phosphodiesterase